ncbi:thermonuclease family protein [Calothrix sp. UHCC 0171]|uniref:thermonuclease family protein n=1 Tax=Calothrix sp. UHCC 0171 TaxID=3110245 RepID=UPI002B20A888|nr:thermonuclease family protein [Calothrix sp. UHCC 0171]MEA5574107.1 thermonuclease family protein [Calothrix sp. UHCC 0171]
MTKNIILFFFILILAGCQPQKQAENAPIQVKVVRVVSGQTFEVMGLGEQPNLVSQVRLIGIDAPDLRQRPWGDNAKEHLQELIAEQPVNLEFDIEAKDKTGRIIAYVWKEKLLLNEQLVKDGLAIFAARSPNHKYDLKLERAQQWARLMGQGIWNPEKPMRVSPAEFRRVNR